MKGILNRIGPKIFKGLGPSWFNDIWFIWWTVKEIYSGSFSQKKIFRILNVFAKKFIKNQGWNNGYNACE